MRKVDDYEDGPGCGHNSHPESLPRATMTCISRDSIGQLVPG